MIGYRDMTFCDFYLKCDLGHICKNALTLGVKEAAAKWWKGPDAPVYYYLEPPQCFSDKKTK
jgi:hypothetical protein